MDVGGHERGDPRQGIRARDVRLPLFPAVQKVTGRVGGRRYHGHVPTPRERSEQIERDTLSPHAVLAAESRGRERPEPPDAIRTCFQRDRDRIVHSKAFRRLKHKTQVFLAPEGDHYRVRLTHTLDVSHIARTVARALRLNEDLTEAIALGHDLGHTPFGHLGEQALTPFLGRPFRHSEQSLRVVEHLEDDGRGLNLTWEVGDAIRAGVLRADELPAGPLEVLGTTHSARINTLVSDLVEQSDGKPDIRLSSPVFRALDDLRDFMFAEVYLREGAHEDHDKAVKLLRDLFEHYLEHPDELPAEHQRTPGDLTTRVADHIAGMTDRYALRTYERLFLPRGWLL